jgi:hypothetical protein
MSALGSSLKIVLSVFIGVQSERHSLCSVHQDSKFPEGKQVLSVNHLCTVSAQ